MGALRMVHSSRPYRRANKFNSVCAHPQVPTGYTFMAFSSTVLSGSGSTSLTSQGMKVGGGQSYRDWGSGSTSLTAQGLKAGEGRWWPRHT